MRMRFWIQAIDEIDETLEDQGFVTDLVLYTLGTTATGTATTTSSSGYIRKLWLNNDGYEYTKIPNVAISTSPSGNNATAVAITTSVNNIHSVKELLITNVGSGYTVVPTVTIVSAATTATNGSYHLSWSWSCSNCIYSY